MSGNYFDIADWRYQMAALYEMIVKQGDLAASWPNYVARRHYLYHNHNAGINTASPIAPCFFPYNHDFALASHFEAIEGASPITVSGGADGGIEFTAIARSVELHAIFGAELTLYAMNQYGGGLFLPFGDATNNKTSYGGGRYLIDSVKSAWLGRDEQGRIRLDFNYAYFPSCAHDHRFVCPLSPAENILPVDVNAGECLAADM